VQKKTKKSETVSQFARLIYQKTAFMRRKELLNPLKTGVFSCNFVILDYVKTQLKEIKQVLNMI